VTVRYGETDSGVAHEISPLTRSHKISNEYDTGLKSERIAD